MRRVRKFLLLPPAERLLLMRAVLLLWGTRIGLSLLPLRRLERLLIRIGRAPDGRCGPEQMAPGRIAWLVGVAGRFLPGPRCLAEALVTQLLLARRGYPSRVLIGVAKDVENGFEAHAWVEHRGEIIIGGRALERYTPLLTMTSEIQ
jgi:hypothetical protein